MFRKVILAVAFLALTATGASAASRVWISEFSALTATQSGGVPGQMAALPAKVLQPTLDISVSVQTSAAFNAETRYVRVVCEVQCAIRGDGVAATTSATLMPALSPEYFGVVPGSTISVIAAP